ncbi:RHS repeat-associated core domain-containing protein [Prevotella sp. OH937_COT-195]|uniref:RHS repeat-associated core domain-containing protein n=1 Tax=Prevotella sp. OH937_COT-195 TaxID=2491051 RepID=UPI001F221895|nr:RHS repeat-associated core domain-containing protein [Prevotella sp. OH937_COT-195]
MYDYGARRYDAATCRFTTMDPLAEKYYSTSPYAYCVNNPMRFVDPDVREWKYVIDANINVALNLSVSGNYTTAQISAYKNAISTQFHNTIYEF